MKPAAKFALIGVVVAGGIALAAGLYLRKSHEAVQRVVKPVELSAPDLFPAHTLLYTEMSGWDRSFARAEAWWKRFEPTATWAALQSGWKKNKLGLPEEAVKTFEKIEKELDRVEEKFGYRPTTRQFFETYGKHIAIGVLPAEKGKHPRLLLATRLPDDAPKALQGYLSKAGGVKPVDPPLHKGFPVYHEPQAAGGEDTVYYGVGRGYLFVSDSLPELKASLERLALATDGKDPKKPEGTLAGDPVLTRVRPPKGKTESGVIYLRRDTKLADWKEELAPVDEFIRNAFVLAPKDEAVAFSMPDGPDGEIRSSFQAGAPKPWMKSLPPGLVYLEASVPKPPGETRRAREAEADAFFSKPLWKEIDAFLSDPKKVKGFLEEAVPADHRPDAEIVSRVQHDARLAGAWMKEWLLTAVNVPDPQYAAAWKVFPGAEGPGSTQFAFGIDIDPMTIFLIAGGLDFARSRWSEWVVRDERPGVLTWSLDMKRALQELRGSAPPETVEMIETFYANLGPAVIVAGSRVVLVFGPEFANEIAAIHSGGGASFDDDPLFKEARGQLKPGFSHVSWDRPWERIRAGYGDMLTWVEKMLERAGHDEDRLDIVHAGLKSIHKAIDWAKPTRAILTTSYADPARPSETVELVDAEAEKKVPVLVPADAPVKSTELLPADTWLYRMQRLELKPSYDALRAAFVEALPGGEARLKEMAPKDNEKVTALLDAVIEGLVRNVKGEVGFAFTTPHPKMEEQPGPTPQALVARMPAVVVFAQVEKPLEAFRAMQTVLETIHNGINPSPWRERLERRGEWDPLPFGSELNVGMIGEYRGAVLDLFVPAGDEYAVLSFCAVERAGFLFLTNSGEVLKRFGTAKEKDADSLSVRLAKAIPAGATPDKVSALGLFHGDTLVAQIRLYLEMLTRVGPGLTLGGYEEGPPAERYQAHVEGWTRWMDLVLDLFKTKSWTVGTTVRTGNIIRSTKVVVAEK